MKSNKEYMESIMRKHELRLEEKNKKVRATRRLVLVVAPIVLCLAVVGTMALTNIFGPGKNNSGVVYAKDLMSGIVSKKIAAIDGMYPDEKFMESYMNFALESFKGVVNEKGERESLMMSPLSAYLALAMTANGAEGETKTSMENVLGMDIDNLNKYLLSYADMLTGSSDESTKFNIANSIWLRDDENLIIKEDFLQTNADYYGAQAYQTAFDDKTVEDINNWVDINTYGMIKKIIDDIKENEMMFLINAIAFDGEWVVPYEEYQVNSGVFTNSSGAAEMVEYMSGQQTTYMLDENAIGFMKHYKNGYGFVAILPNEGVSVEEYVDGLTTEKWFRFIKNKAYAEVNTKLPKFKNETTIPLTDILKQMGMSEAFNRENADFSNMGTFAGENLYISGVLQQTYISVDEMGTQAGAVTSVTMAANASKQQETVNIFLNRPFVYAIIDMSTDMPIFIGTVNTIE
ncbi:MAG: serpin family protein [Lachnospiraceae bacterium]|nr:serpin family protein [Lachnospiraceae bacterium]